MERVYLALNWLFGINFLLMAFMLLFFDVKLSIPIFIISCLFIPPVKKFLHSKTKISIPTSGKVLFFILLLIPFFYFMNVKTDKMINEYSESEKIKKVNEIDQKTQKYLNEYNDDKNIIYEKINEAIKNNNLLKAELIAKDYLFINDNKILDLYNSAKSQRLIQKLKSIPETDYYTNKESYNELTKIFPENKDYKLKYEYYSNKVASQQKEQRKKEQEQRIALQKEELIKKQFHPWDGSHIALEGVIKQSMNDPDSYEHVKTMYIDKGDYLIIETQFRGKNAFGGLVLDSLKAKVSLDGRVLEILER